MPVKIVKKGVQSSARKKPNRGAKPQRFDTLFKHLGPERMAIVDSRLLNGETGESVAKTIKQEWGLMTTHKLLSIAVLLTVYRRERLLTKLTLLGQEDKQRLSEFADKVDVLANLTKLVELQQGRVSKGLHLENGSPLLDRKLRFEVALLGDLYDKLATLQMDLGLLRKVPQKFHIEGAASHMQTLLAQAMQRNQSVDQALNKAFSVLDGKFRVLSDASQH